jgi:hypothetical protein
VWLEHAPDRLGRHQRRRRLVEFMPFAKLGALVDLSRSRPDAGQQKTVRILDYDAKKATLWIAVREPETRHRASLGFSGRMASWDCVLLKIEKRFLQSIRSKGFC